MYSFFFPFFQEINPTLYYMQRQRLVTKVTESPPAWTLNMANVVVHSNQKLNLTTGEPSLISGFGLVAATAALSLFWLVT